MESAASIRAVPAVAAFDATDHIAEYGFVRADPESLAAARKLVDEVAKAAQVAIGERLKIDTACRNPYRDSVQIGGAEVKFAMVADVFRPGVVSAHIDRVFGEGKRERPDRDVLNAKIAREVAALIQPFGYELAGVEAHRDGSLARVAVRDPVYAAEAAKKRGVALEVTRDIDFATALARVTENKSDTGVRWVSSPEKTVIIEQHVEKLAEQAVQAVRDSLRGSVAGGNSPFSKSKEVFAWASAAVVDRQRLGLRWKSFRVPMAAKIQIASNDAIMSSVQQQCPATEATLDQAAFMKHYRETVARHLRANPDLRAALVTEVYEYFGSRSTRGTVVVCGADALRPWYKRMLGLGKPKQQALPAPVAEPPKPVVVGPVALPGQSSTT